MRIFAQFKLKPGVSHDDYLEWARTVDLPTVNGLPSIESFRVFRATGLLGRDEPAPYDYIEVLDIRDMEAFRQDVSTPAMKEVAATFRSMVEVSFVTTEEVEA